MTKRYIVLVCGATLWCTSAMAGVKVNCGDTDIYGNVNCTKYCEDCAQSECVLAGVSCNSGGGLNPIDPTDPIDPITPTSCTEGQYKYTFNKLTTCRDCPKDTTNGAATVTSNLGATSASDCYIPSGTSFSDGTGSGTFTGKCNY